MKCVFGEISNDDWANNSFKPSRVLKTSKTLPPNESFAYESTKEENSDHNTDNSIEITQNWAENLEDDNVDLREARPNRGRRFVVNEDSDDDFSEVIEVNSTEEEDVSKPGFEDEEEEVEAGDVVGKVLQKGAKISMELRRELYGSSVTACDRYAEVEASSMRIATQEESDRIITAAGSWPGGYGVVQTVIHQVVFLFKNKEEHA
ncbi:hypothetical protein F0562_032371 [Nyssa sinensis]|uniref:Uncharacterized protein n=1 Tax=Nyssa sinensis TaxID=561372 RepID=A0A5J5APY8_9ASTE|nr:hypothetical protein F0562_032371 [Nyssa sinensis]